MSGKVEVESLDDGWAGAAHQPGRFRPGGPARRPVMLPLRRSVDVITGLIKGEGDGDRRDPGRSLQNWAKTHQIVTRRSTTPSSSGTGQKPSELGFTARAPRWTA